ncbi:hypothetical protein D1647_13855 [Alistipes sp. Z76]|nr:hypothetical protein [Alistipes sp. Z76]
MFYLYCKFAYIERHGFANFFTVFIKYRFVYAPFPLIVFAVMTHLRKRNLVALAFIPISSTIGMAPMMTEPVSPIFMPFGIDYCLTT